MSIQVIETGEIMEELTRVEAERLTARIADKLDSIADNLEQVLPLIGEALTRGAWHSLGYASPTAYVSERFAKAFERLPVEIRRPVVAQLSAAGMSTRQIAPVVGVQYSAVAKDLRNAGVSTGHTSPEPPADDARDFTDYGLPKSEKIIGQDGKQYPRPEPNVRIEPASEPAKPRAEPVAAQFTAAIVELNKVMARLNRISENPNFTKNKNQIATLHGSDLARTISELETLAESLN